MFKYCILLFKRTLNRNVELTNYCVALELS